MYRNARLFINKLINIIERLIVAQVSDQINKGREQGVLPRQYNLTPRILDELHVAGANLSGLVLKRRWRASTILPALDLYEEILDRVAELYEEDHEDRDGGWVFCPRNNTLDLEDAGKWPKSRKTVLFWIASLRRSTQFVLISETGYGQSTISEATKDLELDGFVNQVKIRTIVEGSPDSTRENLITLTGAGKTVCSELFGKEFVKSVSVEMDQGDADHTLFLNIILSTKNFEARLRSFGETAKECRIHSSASGGCYILPDAIVDFDHPQSMRGENLPLEAEYKSNISVFGNKAYTYLRSDEERVIIVCRNYDMAKKYMKYIYKKFRSERAWYSKQTMFEFFYLEWHPREYVLVRIGSVVI